MKNLEGLLGSLAVLGVVAGCSKTPEVQVSEPLPVQEIEEVAEPVLPALRNLYRDDANVGLSGPEIHTRSYTMPGTSSPIEVTDYGYSLHNNTEGDLRIHFIQGYVSDTDDAFVWQRIYNHTPIDRPIQTFHEYFQTPYPPGVQGFRRNGRVHFTHLPVMETLEPGEVYHFTMSTAGYDFGDLDRIHFQVFTTLDSGFEHFSFQTRVQE